MMMFDVNVDCDDDNDTVVAENVTHSGIDERPDVWEPITVMLELHPTYLHIFKQSIVSMFYGDGPLPYHHRHYLAIMAACRHKCQFLIALHKTEFISCGGDESWLSGTHADAQKLRDFDVLNRILAHQPWQIQATNLQTLLQVSSPNNWSLSELVHGAVILSHIHAFCSFVHGCGVTYTSSPIVTTNGVTTAYDVNSHNQPSSTANHQNGSADTNVEELVARMRELSEKHVPSSQEDKLQQFLDINVQSSEISPGDENQGASNVLAKNSYSAFTDDTVFCYVDFLKRSDPSAAHTFKIHDYSWEDQGYGVINQFCGQLCNVVDDKFRLIENLTYRTMGDHNDVDTSKYRTAIWKYIQSLYGIRHDDYDYSEVNRLLSRQMKIFVKTVGCYPDRTTNALRASVMVDFHHSEKVHVNLLVYESRFQAELLYLLRALTRILV